MLQAKHHFIIHPFLKYYTLWIVRRGFGIIEVQNNLEERNLPRLVISNHMSWWDGFWAAYLSVKELNRKFFHFMMLERYLRKHWFLNYTGGFSIDRNSRSLIESLNYSGEVLADKNNMVLMFPEGEIQSMHKQSFQFERGLDYIIKKTKNEVQIVFVANFVDCFSYRKPGWYSYLSEYKKDSITIADLEAEYNKFTQPVLKISIN